MKLITPIIGKKKLCCIFPLTRGESVLLIKKLSEEGKFKAVIDRKYALEEIAEAFRYVKRTKIRKRYNNV
ncbi:MAG: zinc-binding dehydrogenase [Bacteroidota bacterium]